MDDDAQLRALGEALITRWPLGSRADLERWLPLLDAARQARRT